MPVPTQVPLKFLDPEILRSLRSLDIAARLLVEGMYASRHRCPYYGFSVEFKDYREYAPGDEPRLIDWKMLGRTERYYVRRFEMESNMNVVILLDISGSMGYRPLDIKRFTKFEYACYTAASLAYLAIRQQDAPGFIAFGTEIRTFIPPRQGQRHLFTLLSCLQSLAPGGETKVAECISMAALRLSRRGLVLLLSDCHGDENAITDAVRRLAARGHDVVVFHLVDADEVDFPIQMLTSFRDIETGEEVMCDPLRQRRDYLARFAAFRENIRAGSIAGGADYRFVHTAMPIEQVLREYLICRRAAK